ncbi:TonB-dependent receptor [Lichenicoccus roseus]|uniref:TonB-dependent receptor n=1 Tax=Lichenicoccus roseus TaxID=2683649 RepID=A0A5R9JCB4_9PROT|nr:TonB-dependent receptor [Lichenicoccus roseus]TLU74403.1 TonB-dependent receptor [Lichenicoccus roseus]
MDKVRRAQVCAFSVVGAGLIAIGGPAAAQGAQGAEQIVVEGQGGFDSADGVHGTAPGGGLISVQTGPQSSSEVTRDFIQKQSPSANAFQLISLVPGANVSTADPLGLSTQVGLTVRGLGETEIGTLLDGMPLNDAAYYNSYPSQFIDSENLESVSLAQGSADLDAPLLNAAGGVLSLMSRDPSGHAGGFIDGSYGSYHSNREFIRLESGTLGASGLRAYLSYSHAAADNARGEGRDKRQHVDFKLVREWGDGNDASLLVTWHDAVTTSYPEPDLADWHAYGFSNNYDGTFSPGDANYWRLYQQPYRLVYGALPLHITLTPHLHLSLTAYAQYGYGNSPGGTTLSTSGLFEGTQPVPDTLSLPGTVDGSAAVEADYVGQTWRSGVVPSITWDAGPQHLTLGAWYEYVDEHDTQPFSALSPDGTPADIWLDLPNSTILLSDGRQLLASDTHMITQTNAVFVSDRIDLLSSRLTLDLGFKEAMVSRQGWNGLPGAQYRSGFNDAEPLPRIAVRYRIDAHNQLFANATTNFLAPSESTLFATYDPSSGEVASAANTDLRPEYSIAEELGWRYAGDRLLGSLTLFNYNFTNRQVSTVLDLNGALIGGTVNAGGQTSRGIDTEFGLRPWHHLSPYVSGEYLQATIDNDIQSGGDLLPTAGKTAVGSPRWSGAVGLTYDDGTLFGVVSVKYTGPQYATFMDDERISDHTQADMTLGVRLPNIASAQHPELRLNIVNLTDSAFLSGVANPTTNAQNTIGRYGTVIAGTSPTYLVGGGFAALLTASAGF